MLVHKSQTTRLCIHDMRSYGLQIFCRYKLIGSRLWLSFGLYNLGHTEMPIVGIRKERETRGYARTLIIGWGDDISKGRSQTFTFTSSTGQRELIRVTRLWCVMGQTPSAATHLLLSSTAYRSLSDALAWFLNTRSPSDLTLMLVKRTT